MTPRFRRLVPLIVIAAGVAVSVALLAVSRWLDRWQPGPTAHPALERLRSHDPFQRLELVTYDWRARRAAEKSTNFSPKLGLIAIDDDSIDALLHGDLLEHPVGPMWPRYVYGFVLQELQNQGAEAIAFDVLLGDERRDHPYVPIPGMTNLSSDAFFAQCIADSGAVILASLSNFPPALPFRRAAWQIGEAASPRDIDGSARRVDAFVDYQLLHPTVEIQARRQRLRIMSATNNAIQLRSRTTDKPVEWPIESDGSIKVPLSRGSMKIASAFQKKRVWHMGIVLAARRLGLDLSNAEIRTGSIRLVSTNGQGFRELPVMPDNRFPVNWSVTCTNYDRFPVQGWMELLGDYRRRENPDNPPPESRWTNALVVIGSTATGNNFSDVSSTPLAAVDFLPSTYLNVADSVLRGRFVRIAPAWMSYGVVLGLSLLAAVAAWRLSPVQASLGVVALGVLWVMAADAAFQYSHWWLPIAHPLLAGIVLNYATMLTYRNVFERTERQRVRSIFSKIVSPNVVQELLTAESVHLGGARRELTVFFADVRGFTELTDHAQAVAEEHVRQAKLKGADLEAYYEEQAAELLRTVNIYLATIADVVKQHRGTLDKYIGDCVMAFWGAPTPNPRHAADAVCAAVEAQRAMHRLNQDRDAESRRREVENVSRIAAGQAPLPVLPQLALGSGINTGYMTVGLMGSDSHILNYTVFGREVNLASRLEGVSGRGRIIIGDATYTALCEQMPELAARCIRLDPVTVKGFRQPVPIYEVPWKDPELAVVKATAAS